MKTCQNTTCNEQLPEDASFCHECGQPFAEQMQTIGGMETNIPTPGGTFVADMPALEPGTVFANRYKIVEQIGRGGMGAVYKAQDEENKETIALKVIRPRSEMTDADIQRLIQEGLTTRKIRHKNVVAVHDAAQFEGQPYITMELLEGRSLRAFVNESAERNRESISMRTADSIIRSLLSGLQAAHEQGVIHRDLKPENITISGDDSNLSVKILDFGIARAMGANAGASQGLGTHGYMAPEQLTQAHLAGPEADLYSVSRIFYELLVGVLPQGHWEPPSSGRSDVPRTIDLVIQQGLSTNPKSRPKSATDYLNKLPALRQKSQAAVGLTKDNLVFSGNAVRSGSTGSASRQSQQTNSKGDITQFLLSSTMRKIVGGSVLVMMAMLFLVVVVAVVIDDESTPSPNNEQDNSGFQIASEMNRGEVAMPNLMGLTLSAAKQKLTDNGLSSNFFGFDGPGAIVVDQDPLPETPLPDGETISFWLGFR